MKRIKKLFTKRQKNPHAIAREIREYYFVIKYGPLV